MEGGRGADDRQCGVQDQGRQFAALGGHPGWAAIQVRNHLYPVVKFEYKKNGEWVSLPKRSYNHFVGEKMDAQLLEIRLTDIRGQVVTDTLKALPSQGDKGVYFVEGHVQFAK